MKQKFNGWQRLWIVVCALYLICVLVIAIAIFPSQIYTRDDTLEQQLTPKSLSRLEPRYTLVPIDDKKQGGFDLSTAKPVLDERPHINEDNPKPDIVEEALGHRVEMPDGHILVFKAGLKENEMQNVAHEYNKLIEHKLNNERIKNVLLALLFWIVPSIFLYILGWSVGWIFRGFKKT